MSFIPYLLYSPPIYHLAPTSPQLLLPIVTPTCYFSTFIPGNLPPSLKFLFSLVFQYSEFSTFRHPWHTCIKIHCITEYVIQESNQTSHEGFYYSINKHKSDHIKTPFNLVRCEKTLRSRGRESLLRSVCRIREAGLFWRRGGRRLHREINSGGIVSELKRGGRCKANRVT